MTPTNRTLYVGSLCKKRKKKTMCTRGAMRQGLAALNFDF